MGPSELKKHILEVIVAGAMVFGVTPTVQAQESDFEPQYETISYTDDRDTIRFDLGTARKYAIRHRADGDGSFFPLNRDDIVTYEISFGIQTFHDLDNQVKGFRYDQDTLSFRGLNRIKLSIDNVWGMSVRAIGQKTDMDDSVGGRLVLAALTAGGLGATSYPAHEWAGHGLSAAKHGVQRPDTNWAKDESDGITYAQVMDRWAGGLNNSAELFFEYHRAALEDRLDLVDAAGMVISKFDSWIQAAYADLVEHPTGDWVRTYEKALIESRVNGISLDDDVDLHKIGLLGRGDTRDYVTLLSLRYPNASHEKDTYASLLSAGLSAGFWQSIIFTINYIRTGKESERLWAIPVGPVDVGLPSVEIRRLADGYYGEVRSFANINDTVLLSIEGGVGLPFLGGDVKGYTIGMGLHKFQVPAIEDLKISIAGSVHMDGGVMKGFGGSAEIRYGITDTVELFARAEYSNNSITQRPGFGDKESFVTVGVRLRLD